MSHRKAPHRKPPHRKPPHRTPFHLPLLLLGLVALALTTACAGGCGTDGRSGEGPETPAAPDADPHRGGLEALASLGPVPAPTQGYVVISFDTLRADHLGAYGYPRETTPFMDLLAARGTLFENAVVQYPSTLTSHMSMFTGLYPREHGVLPPKGVLAPEIETFPQVFRRAGYRTAGFTEGGYMRGSFGFRRGFEEFLARDRHDPYEVERTFERGVRFLEGLGSEEPFLLFLHTYAVHAPYEPAEGYEGMFWDESEPPGAFPPTGPQLARINADEKLLSPQVLGWLEALYDATLRHADDVLRGFFGELARLGLEDQVTVILTSDHGEEFQEHGLLNHTQLYQEVMRVPLIVVHPELGPGRYQPLVESIDLAPTLYELAGLEPAGAPTGASFARALGRDVIAGDGVGKREAYGEVGGGRRTLWRRWEEGEGRGGGKGPEGSSIEHLYHLLLFDPPEGGWEARRTRIDTVAREIAFKARSPVDGRELTVAVQGPELDSEPRTLATFPLGTEWATVRLELPPLPAGISKRTLVLSVPECTVPEDVQSLRKWRCQGFQLRGVPRVRAELYDLLRDPRETHDLSDRLRDPTRRMLGRLGRLGFVPRAVARQEELDPEAEQNLRALGYLQ